MGMTRGSPWVVPSWEKSVSLSTKSSAGALYVLIRTVERSGQILRMLRRAICLFKELKALPASTISTASDS